jgi:hypothetical protein
MKGHIVREDAPSLILDEFGIPEIIDGTHLEKAIKEPTPPPEDPVEVDKREKALVAKLWAKARRPGPPLKKDVNPVFVLQGNYIQQEECHLPTKWFAEEGEKDSGAWLHKLPRWTNWGHEFSKDSKKTVDHDQAVMRVMRNFSAPGGPTSEQALEAADLYKREQAERREAERQEIERRKRKRGIEEPAAEEMGGMIQSKTMGGVDVPLGWDEEKGQMGTAQDAERDFENEQEAARLEEQLEAKRLKKSQRKTGERLKR